MFEFSDNRFSCPSRDVLFNGNGVSQITVRIHEHYAIDGRNSEPRLLRPGCIMARLDCFPLWVPMKRSVVVSIPSDKPATVIVRNAAFFKAGDPIRIGRQETVIEAVDYQAHSLTIRPVSVKEGASVEAAGYLEGASRFAGILATGVVVDSFPQPMNGEPAPVNCGRCEVYNGGEFRRRNLIGDLQSALDTERERYRFNGFIFRDAA